MQNPNLVEDITLEITKIISETNGISLNDTLALLDKSPDLKANISAAKCIHEFRVLLSGFEQSEVDIQILLNHPFSKGMFEFFRSFPLPYREEHIHLTGSLDAEFIFPRLQKLLNGPNAKVYEQKIKEVYGDDSLPISSVEDVDNLIRLKDGEQFKQYLKILYLSKLVLNDRKTHKEAAYHLAKVLHDKYNVGFIRLKFTLSRSTSVSEEQIPGLESLTEKDVVFGLLDGFMEYKGENPKFDFILSPSFRKEPQFFDQSKYKTKKEHFDKQVESLLALLEKNPLLRQHLIDVDTVGDERELYRKAHFDEMKLGLRRLQYNGFSVRSHHGETWKILRLGVQSVDNAMNIWHIDTLEHGLSLGVNPNFYFHRLYQKAMELNHQDLPVPKDSSLQFELEDMNWFEKKVLQKILKGKRLNEREEVEFLKTKFHYAREIEHYQHDVLNRMIHKGVGLVALPSSNHKLTDAFPDIKDHPFSWWEKKGVRLSVGTDNYITLSTNFIQELLILLYSDPDNLKITKLLMVATKEERRAYISHLLWHMRRRAVEKHQA
jgi:adenosine deaminase